jgi:glutamate-ammonia-ligase adenylyltransferase
MASFAERAGLEPHTEAALAAAGWLIDGDPAPAADALLAEILRGPDPEGALRRMGALFGADPVLGGDALADPVLGRAVVAVLGASRSLSALASSRPSALRVAAGPGLPPIDVPRERTALRRTVGDLVLAIAVADLTGRLDMPAVGSALSDVADAAACAALRIARSEAGVEAEGAGFAVVAMGKWGGRELNYASDIDVMFVHGDSMPGDLARVVAAGFIDVLAGHAEDEAAYRVDADLRPEGRSGPLARSLGSFRAYWERWAEPWELQALIKARPVAGDARLGEEFLAAAAPFVYPETLSDDAIRRLRDMKVRAESLAERTGGAVELKRGVGGIRDVEFSVQLLQLVHGRSDSDLRLRGTLEALRALGEYGYVRSDDVDGLGAAYRWLRDVEHRLQLFDLRQIHELPAGAADRERVAKAMGYRDEPGDEAAARFERDLVHHRATVRTIHERLFYRPLLEVFAAASAGRLTEVEAARRLAALGFRDVDAARRSFEDLTTGLSRRSRLMQQLLPLMLDWLSQAPNPDLGLAQLRLLVAGSEDHSELVSALRDNPVAAERLCTILGTSRLLGRLLDRIPPFLNVLGDDAALQAFPDRRATFDEASRRFGLRPRQEGASEMRRLMAARLVWIAALDLVGEADAATVGDLLAGTADAVVAATLEAIVGEARRRGADPPPLTVIALGKWGGGELNYASDLDAVVVHDPAGREPSDAAAAAEEVVAGLLAEFDTAWAAGPAFRLDLGLRPEGKAGPLSRTIEGYRVYWDRWSDVWEIQAMLRARPVAGDLPLGEAFLAAAEPVVYRGDADGSRAGAVRRMKARIEAERIPPHEDPDFNLKLGRGGMSDVEWTVQLLQLRHGGDVPEIRTPGTVTGLAALEAAGLMATSDAAALDAAYRFCARVRNRLYLQAGRQVDALPVDADETTRLARSLGYVSDPRSSLREEYRRVTRRARRVTERMFYRD